MLHYIEHKYYHTCPLCGSNLDPGEYCDCEKETNDNITIKPDNYKNVQEGGEKKHVNFNVPHICHIR